ncbi:MAG: hypothetical protein DMF91_17960, partial [Acidobacteria bacterium]
MTPIGWYHLLFFGVVIPLAAIRSEKRIGDRPLPTRRRHFIGTTVTLWLLTALSLWTAWAQA